MAVIVAVGCSLGIAVELRAALPAHALSPRSAASKASKVKILNLITLFVLCWDHPEVGLRQLRHFSLLHDEDAINPDE